MWVLQCEIVNRIRKTDRKYQKIGKQSVLYTLLRKKFSQKKSDNRTKLPIVINGCWVYQRIRKREKIYDRLNELKRCKVLHLGKIAVLRMAGEAVGRGTQFNVFSHGRSPNTGCGSFVSFCCITHIL